MLRLIVFVSILLIFQGNGITQEVKKNDISVNLIMVPKILTSYSNYYTTKPFNIFYKRKVNDKYFLRIGIETEFIEDWNFDTYLTTRGQFDVARINQQSNINIPFAQSAPLMDKTDSSLTYQYYTRNYDPNLYLKTGIEYRFNIKQLKFSLGSDLLYSHAWNQEFTFKQTFILDTTSLVNLNQIIATTDAELQTSISVVNKNINSAGIAPFINLIIPIKNRWEIHIGTYIYWMISFIKKTEYYHQTDQSLNSNYKSWGLETGYRMNNLSVHYKF